MPTHSTSRTLYQGVIADRLPAWLAKATGDDLQRLHTLSAQAQASRAALESAAQGLPQFQPYATAALNQLLANAGETEVDPSTAVLHWVSTDSDSEPLTCTLLQAALRNFTEEDAKSEAFGPGSGLYRDSLGASTPDPAKRLALEPWAFARACRAADVGAGYARLLATRLPEAQHEASPPAISTLPSRFIEADKDALRVEACIARMKGKLDTQGEAMLANWGLASQAVAAVPARARQLRLAGFELDRVLVIMADDNGPHGRACLLYIPNDPQAPLCQFDNADAMSAHLRTRLGQPAYLRFMAGFVGLEHEQAFIRAVKGPAVEDFDHLYGTVVSPLQALELAVRLIDHETPFPRPVIATGFVSINDLFPERYAAWVRQTLADAAVLAVPTERIDRAAVLARHQRWVALGEQLGLLVLSFIPGVGQAIGVYSMVQLLHTVFDASRALGRGDERLARALLLGAAENAGTLLASPEQPGVTETEAFADRLQLITHPDGTTRLWLPDMAQLGSDAPPEGAGPLSADGIVRAGQQAWVRLDDRYVGVSPDVTPWQATLLAPAGYRGVVPRLLSNGHGGWRGEFEQPGGWNAITLVRRGGVEANGVSDTDVSLALSMADVSVTELQGRASRGEPLPGVLRLLLHRRAAALAVDQATAALIARQGLAAAHPNIVRTLAEVPGWPEDMGIELAWPDGQARTLHPTALRSVRLEATAFTQGDWLSGLVRELSTADLAPMIGDWSTLETAGHALADRWAEVLEARGAQIIDGWTVGEQAQTVAAPIARQFPSLPPQILNELVRACDGGGLNQLQAGRVPLAVAELAAGAQRDVRLSLACEALANGTPSADRDALLIGLLPAVEGWPESLAIELRSQGSGGLLVHRAGPADGAALRIERSAQNTYATTGQPSGAFDSLEAAIVEAVARSNLAPADLPWNATGLRSRLVNLALTRRAALRPLLGMAADTRPFFRAPLVQADGRLGYPLSGRGYGLLSADVIGQLLRQLYPDTDYGTLQALRQELGEGTAALQELARRHTEANELRLQLGQWLASLDHTASSSSTDQTIREVAAGAIIQGWQRRYVATQAQVADGATRHSLSLRHLHVGANLPALSVPFPHVLELDLTDMNMAQVAPAFLELFPNARVLSLSGNPLRELPSGPAWLSQLREVRLRDLGMQSAETVLDWLQPSAATLQGLDLSANPAIPNVTLLERISRFTALRDLELDDNGIELTAERQTVFTALTNLVSLSLDRNPLRLPPSLEGLSRLQWLSIADAGLSALPAGLQQLLAAPELRLTYVNLAGNRITELPDLQASEFFRRARRGDHRATFLYFNLDGNPLNEAAVAQLDQTGLEFDPAEGTDSTNRWLEGCPEPLQARISQARDEPEARSFFQVLSEVVRTATYVRARTGEQRREVTSRAWALAERFLPVEGQPLPGITELRDRLYDMAREALATCGDGVALTLDQFEGEVAVWEAIAGAAEGTSTVAMGAAATVARRQFRLALLDAQAQRLVRARQARSNDQVAADPATDLADDLPADQLDMGLDEVEVRLVLRQRLREELDLPAVSERLYEALVSDTTAAAVARQVRALDTPGAFAQWLIDHQQTWRSTLERYHASEFERERAPYDEALAHILALAAGEVVTDPLSPAALAALEAVEPEVEWQRPDGAPSQPTLSEQQAYVLSNSLNQRCTRAMDALRLRLTRALLD
ncbi:dermonecrotic toxin domain-containing protein [Pseudomonas japonica]|uniref:dermonecrotic toxin domain-containing protein n=1 Tax=Pseudomonas japonica TaxID=256466 RepID=UPI0015E3C7AD|nr:DUF6543 domain-containing protein [Pseudomonas japonica]MBA1245179.1 hypothetical protein [Pseudomonas japonica]